MDTTARRLLGKITSGYRTAFSISEIESTKVLQWMFGSSLLFFFATFNWWMQEMTASVESGAIGTTVCWPYFPDCAKLFFLHGLPYGYSQTTFYMGLFAVMLAIVYCMYARRWAYAHMLMSILFVWKVFMVFVLSYEVAGVYDYYHIALTFILLFLPYKEYFLKVCFVLLYFLSATTKFYQTWLLGTYFTSLKTGIPIFPDSLTPLITNSVIFMQIVGSWFLLSRNKILQRLTTTYFAIFHLYSGILVLYHYPTVAFTSIVILFGPLYRHTPPSTTLKKGLPGALFLLALILFQLPGYLIEGDQKLTLEGNRFGMFMFEANHQCIATIKIYTPQNGAPVAQTSSAFRPGTPCKDFTCVTKTRTYTEGEYNVREETWESPVAWSRCDPYVYFSKTKFRCQGNVAKISMQYDHSVDGGPFYRLIDEPDICHLTYQPFVHNAWIKLPPEAPIVGYPVQNVFRYPSY